MTSILPTSSPINYKYNEDILTLQILDWKAVKNRYIPIKDYTVFDIHINGITKERHPILLITQEYYWYSDNEEECISGFSKSTHLEISGWLEAKKFTITKNTGHQIEAEVFWGNISSL